MLVEKRSQAVKLWFAVLIGVLALMYWETLNRPGAEYNLVVQANSEAVGAKVIIDGQERGVINAADRDDIGGACFRDKLPRGQHLLEVRKPGFKTFSETVAMKQEAFVGVDLQPESR